MWINLLSAIALVLIIEGIWPFIRPEGMKRALAMMLQLSDRHLRTAGLASMLAGLVLLYLVRHIT